MPFSKEQVGACIRAERARLGWSRDKLAAETGIPAATISTYENNECRITLENAWKLADAFGIAIGALAGRDESAYQKKAS